MNKHDHFLSEAIGEAVRSARQELELTQAEVAREVGCSERHIDRIEAGQTVPTVVSLRHLAEYLGFSVDEVLAAAARNEADTPENKRIRELAEQLRRSRSSTVRFIGLLMRRLIPRV